MGKGYGPLGKLNSNSVFEHRLYGKIFAIDRDKRDPYKINILSKESPSLPWSVHATLYSPDGEKYETTARNYLISGIKSEPPPVAAPPVDPFDTYTPIVTDPSVTDMGDGFLGLNDGPSTNMDNDLDWGVLPKPDTGEGNGGFTKDYMDQNQARLDARETGKKTYNYDTAPFLMPPGPGNSVSGVPLQLGWKGGGAGKSKRKRRRNKKTRRNSRRKTKRRR